jgi:fumarate reductase flavoprotein subunit
VDVIEVDIAIVGAGGAGLRAAIAAAEADRSLALALISKVYPMRSHTVAAEGGAAGVIKDNDSLDNHFNDTVSGGDWLCDQDAVELFVNTAPLELLQLEHWGCPWSRETNGKVAVRPFGGMKIERTWYAADKTGFHILHTLFQTSLKYPSIKRFDEYYSTDLIVEDGRCTGVIAIEMRSGRMVMFRAKAVVIATGGAGRIFPFTTNGAIKTGDGMAMAYRAGVPLKDIEFIQYHPTGLPGTGILITEGSRGEGGILVNKDGYRYLQDYNLGPPDPWPRKKAMELGPRDRLCQAFWHEQQKGRTIKTSQGDVVYLDIRHLGEKKINERLPMVRELAEAYVGVDPVHAMIPVRPVVHYTMGGIHTDINTATSLPGLFAAGECACVSINGANRLGLQFAGRNRRLRRPRWTRGNRFRQSQPEARGRRQGGRGGATAPARTVRARRRQPYRLRPAQIDERHHGKRRWHLPERRHAAKDLRHPGRPSRPISQRTIARPQQCLQHRPDPGARARLHA